MSVLNQLRAEYGDDAKKFENDFYTMKGSLFCLGEMCEDIQLPAFCGLMTLMETYVDIAEELLLSRKIPSKEWRAVPIRTEHVQKISESFKTAFAEIFDDDLHREIFLREMNWRGGRESNPLPPEREASGALNH